MPQLVIPDIDEETLRLLSERAANHIQSVEVEAKTILTDALQTARPADAWSSLNAMREQLADSGRDFPDSTPLVREDRDQ